MRVEDNGHIVIEDGDIKPLESMTRVNALIAMIELCEKVYHIATTAVIIWEPNDTFLQDFLEESDLWGEYIIQKESED